MLPNSLPQLEALWVTATWGNNWYGVPGETKEGGQGMQRKAYMLMRHWVARASILSSTVILAPLQAATLAPNACRCHCKPRKHCVRFTTELWCSLILQGHSRCAAPPSDDMAAVQHA